MYDTLAAYLKDNWLLAVSTPLYAVLIALEVIVSNYRKNQFYTFRETLINFWLNIANTALGLSVKFAVLAMMSWFFAWHFIPLTFWEQHPVLYWVLLFFALDLCFYFEHRSEHFSRLLWAVHVTHHSSQEYNLTTGFRSSVFRPLVSCWFFVPLVFLGFRPLDILLMDAICQIYGIMVHTRYVKKMPAWFETFFVSPSHHRVHHASNIIYLDKNMGMVLIIWDRMFGTFQRELESETVVYGLTKNLDRPYHPLHIIFHEWKSLFQDLSQKNITFRHALHYLFDAPGWSHDGSRKTAKQLRKEIEK
ncbi:MAG: sterol desaturase family protein [Chitinophagaceae bacterium]|nr:sterol desaturase family protein [Chitinophagaceae bacterium]